MSTIKTDKQITLNNNLFKDYFWFCSNIFSKVQKSIDEFFQKDFKLRFMGITQDENIFFYGDEYIVNKIPAGKNADIVIKFSANCIKTILDNVLGNSEVPFVPDNMTDIESTLIKSFSMHITKQFNDILVNTGTGKKRINPSCDYEFTFFMRNNSEHSGKILISIPSFLIPEIKPAPAKENFTIADFKTSQANVKISAGSAKITLSDIKAIEDGDIIVLDNSDINKMSVIWNDKKAEFKITPNPSLIISVNNNGENEMEEEVNKSPNMWDSILVDVIAEFDNVKLTLGELKEISEGLVIDLGSVYDNKIKLRVENQIVATGELVILNDRYGVKIESIKKSKEPQKPKPAPPPQPAPAAPPKGVKEQVPPQPAPAAAAKKRPPVNPKQPAKPAQPANKNEDKNFDYSDFEIEDESI